MGAKPPSTAGSRAPQAAARPPRTEPLTDQMVGERFTYHLDAGLRPPPPWRAGRSQPIRTAGAPATTGRWLLPPGLFLALYGAGYGVSLLLLLAATLLPGSLAQPLQALGCVGIVANLAIGLVRLRSVLG